MSATQIITVIDVDRIEALNREHQLVQRAYEDALAHALECGRLLTDIKDELAYGEWYLWLEENFTGSPDTAQLYMRVAANPERIPDFRTLGEAKRGLAKPRATIPPPEPEPEPASVQEVRGLLQGLNTDNASTPTPATPSVAVTPDARQLRQRHKIIDLIEESHEHLNSAFNGDLSAYGITSLLRQAEVTLRRASAEVGDLAFSFER